MVICLFCGEKLLNEFYDIKLNGFYKLRLIINLID